MSHANITHFDTKEINNADSLKVKPLFLLISKIFMILGAVILLLGFFGVLNQKHFWATYYINFIFFTGLATGSVIIAVIFQIVRAKWSISLRRIAEAGSAFFPYAFLLFLGSFFGREYLFTWARSPMPGREQWMSEYFVYGRFTILFLILFLIMRYFVKLSINADLKFLAQNSDNDQWKNDKLKDEADLTTHIKGIQKKLSNLGPVVVLAYVVIYSLFSFEMIMGMNPVWFSNMFGGFNFLGNIYISWAFLIISIIFYSTQSDVFKKYIKSYHLWDLGKLTFGFCMLWGYTFFSQYLPQWYGNMPEETVWLMARVTGVWKPFSYMVFGMCFVMPFIWLLSRNLKKTPFTISLVCGFLMFGVWLEKYVVIMPELFPNSIPFFSFNLVIEMGMLLGFLGLYLFSVFNFLKKYPMFAVSNPMIKGSVDW